MPPATGARPTLTGGLLEFETELHELSAEFVISCPSFQHIGLVTSPTGFSSCSAPTVGAFAELGSCCAWPPPCGGCAEVVSARLNLSHGMKDVRGVCNFLGSVSS